MAESSSPVADFFRDKSILVTGATGFMGKVLVEKLLRTCSPKTIYLLMRPKRGQEPAQRLVELFKSKVFDRVKEEQPECTSKVVAIPGDVSTPRLGISEDDQSLLIQNVSIVFHSAATVKFSEPFMHYYDMNLMGTKRIIELCHKIVHLEALVHVSTAYCHCERDQIDEVLYDPPAHPKNIIDIVQWMDEDMINDLSPHFLRGRPNYYVCTKAMAETLLGEEGKGLPVAIVRPAIVTAAWKEPFPGWVDSFNGPVGILIAGSKGLLHSVRKKAEIAELIPVDVVVNLMISVAWYTAVHSPSRLLVYNCCSSNANPITWSEVRRTGNRVFLDYPSCDVISYPYINMPDSRRWHQICVLVRQLLPAYVLDLAARITGRKPMLVTLQRKIDRSVAPLDFFLCHQHTFDSRNVQRLSEKVTPEDKKIFNFDIRGLDWPTYMQDYILGVRQFIMKEDPSTIPEARRKLKRLYWIEKSVYFVLLLLLLKLVLVICSVFGY